MTESSSTTSGAKRPRASTQGSIETAKSRKSKKNKASMFNDAPTPASQPASQAGSTSLVGSQVSWEPSLTPSAVTSSTAKAKQAQFDLKHKADENTPEEILGSSFHFSLLNFRLTIYQTRSAKIGRVEDAMTTTRPLQLSKLETTASLDMSFVARRL